MVRFKITPPGCRSGLRHCIAVLVVRPEILGSSPGSVASGLDRETRLRRSIGPAPSGLGEGLAGRYVLVPLCTSDSCGGPGAVHADTVARFTVFPLSFYCPQHKGIFISVLPFRNEGTMYLL